MSLGSDLNILLCMNLCIIDIHLYSYRCSPIDILEVFLLLSCLWVWQPRQQYQAEAVRFLLPS